MKNINSFKESKFLKSVLIAFAFLFFPIKSYSYVVGVIVNGGTLFTNVNIFDETNSWNLLSSMQMTMSGFTIVGANSVALNPINGLYYSVVNVVGSGQIRRLVIVDPATGNCTDVGSMGASISTITFSPTGTLYAMGGSGSGTFAEKLYSVDLSNGSLTFLGGPYSVGADGEIIAYNSSDNNIYHWSGHNTNAMEKIDASSLIATTITQSGSAHREIFGAVYKGGGTFYACDLDAGLYEITTGGVCTLVDTVPQATRGFAYEQGVFPVELASFTSSVNDNDVTLNWSTVSEINNAGFEIQRTRDQNWERIGYVRGNGTSNSSHSYSFVDRNLNSGVYHYRLKQIDYNGGFEFFNLSNEIVIGLPAKYELSQNYPNPFNPSTKLEFGIPEEGLVSLKVYDALGNELATLVNENKTAGRYTVNFNASNLSSGVYFYKLNAGNFTDVKKMTLLK